MIFGEIGRRLRVLANRKQFESELEEEMQLHAELRASSGQQSRRFGNATDLKEQSRDVWAIRWLEDGLQDIRQAIHQLSKSPGFTAVAVGSLALGIGANTAIFTLIESTLLLPIPVRDAAQLRLVQWHGVDGGWVPPNLGYVSPTYGWIYDRYSAGEGWTHTDFSPPFYKQFLKENTVFDSLFGFKELGTITALVGGSAEPVNCFVVSEDFYRGMNVTPAIGRSIGPGDETDSSGVMISYDYWMRRFDGSPSVIGKTINLNKVPVTIIGVNPEYFSGVVPGGHFEIWAPLSLSAPIGGHSLLSEENVWSLPLMGRLKPGISDAQAAGAFDVIFQQKLDAEFGDRRFGEMLRDPAKRPHLGIVSGARGLDYLTPHYQRTLLALWTLAGLLLLIGVVNVATLLLAKSAARRREIGLRLALGAGRGRILRQLLVEGLPLTVLAGLVGIASGYASRSAIPAILSPPWRKSPFEADLDGKALFVLVGTTVLTGLLFSLAPALQARRVALNESLADAHRGATRLSSLRGGRLLVVLQVALSMLLLAGAGLCIQTFANLRSTPLGLRPEGVRLFTIDPSRQRYSEERVGALLTELQTRLATIPGISSATFTEGGAGTLAQSSSRVRRISVNPAQAPPGVDTTAEESDVGSRFFETMGIPILYGRSIDDHDRLPGIRAVVVNQEFGKRFFQREYAVGVTFNGAGNETYQIVGVCRDWHVDQLRDAVRPAAYGAWVQASHVGPVTFAVKTTDDAAVVREIRTGVSAVDSELAITDIRTQVEQIETDLSREQLMASLAAFFGALALLLASIGVYGVMAYSVARRTNEIGIRMALGAKPGSVAWLVLRETLALTAAGIVIGAPAALALSPILDHIIAPEYRERFTYGMKPNDPLTVLIAVMLLATVSTLAGYLPARRAAGVDPMTALRHD